MTTNNLYHVFLQSQNKTSIAIMNVSTPFLNLWGMWCLVCSSLSNAHQQIRYYIGHGEPRFWFWHKGHHHRLHMSDMTSYIFVQAKPWMHEFLAHTSTRLWHKRHCGNSFLCSFSFSCVQAWSLLQAFVTTRSAQKCSCGKQYDPSASALQALFRSAS